jgi:hypothetical protein
VTRPFEIEQDDELGRWSAPIEPDLARRDEAIAGPDVPDEGLRIGHRY